VEPVRLHRDGALGRLLIDRPDKRNAMSRAMWRTLRRLVDEAAGDRSLRAITLESAAPGCFSAGADIAEFEATYATPEATTAMNGDNQGAIEALARCPQPTVAAIDGVCVGGGVALVLACDFRIGSDAARFAVTPARLGLSYHQDNVRRLVAAVGQSAAAELLFTGQTWAADRALDAGLVNQLVPAAQLSALLAERTAAICANSASANAALKRALQAVEKRDTASRDAANDEFARLFASPDFLEGRDAFLQKRPAHFPSHVDDEA